MIKNNNDNFIFAIDISLSNTGIAIFTDYGNPVNLKSIPTNSKEPHQLRLKTIADSINELRRKYTASYMVYERGFYRYSASTQAIYKAIGVIQLLFNDVEQISYAPSTIRKMVCGNGRANKDDVEKAVSKVWPFLTFEDQDQSDACGVALCHFIDKKILKL